MDYKENIREIAQEVGNDVFKGKPYTLSEYNTLCLPAARIAIRRIVGAVAFALCENGWEPDCTDRWLKEQGLISSHYCAEYEKNGYTCEQQCMSCKKIDTPEREAGKPWHTTY